MRGNLGKPSSIEGWEVDLLRSLIEISDKAKLLGAIGPFAASVSFCELPSASGRYRTRGGHRAEGGFPLGEAIEKKQHQYGVGRFTDICACGLQGGPHY